jgi:hypothetical protein
MSLCIQLKYTSRAHFSIRVHEQQVILQKRPVSSLGGLACGLAVILIALNLMLPIIALGGTVSSPSSVWSWVIWVAAAALILIAAWAQFRTKRIQVWHFQMAPCIPPAVQ